SGLRAVEVRTSTGARGQHALLGNAVRREREIVVRPHRLSTIAAPEQHWPYGLLHHRQTAHPKVLDHGPIVTPAAGGAYGGAIVSKAIANVTSSTAGSSHSTAARRSKAMTQQTGSDKTAI